MFSAIAPTYDRLNHLLSLNRDKVWRRAAMQVLSPHAGDLVLDLCGGTGDLALTCIAQQPEVRRILVADFSMPMLQIAKSKMCARAVPQAADALHLPYQDRAFDAVMIAFGARNLENARQGVREMRRVLREEGKLLVLEFFRPVALPLRIAFRAFFRRIMPVVGRALSGHQFAYSYLPESVESFYTRSEFETLLGESGFGKIQARDLDAGIASIVLATKTSLSDTLAGHDRPFAVLHSGARS